MCPHRESLETTLGRVWKMETYQAVAWPIIVSAFAKYSPREWDRFEA
jgi:hypothetical protein